MTDAFFVPLGGDRYRATEHTRGPWSPDLQHGGPPSALLARALERSVEPGEGPGRIARVTVEFHRPMPLGEVATSVKVVRAGRSVRVTEAVLVVADKPVARATGVRIRTTEVALPPGAEPPPGPPVSPGSLEPHVFGFFPDAPGYHRAVELRWQGGRWGSGRAASWMRPRLALVEGEALSPLQRVLVCADSGNGLSAALDPEEFSFVNPDLTVHLHREPEGEWVLLDATTTVHRDGIGLAESALFDVRGPVGRSLQSLIVERRRG